MKWDVSFFRETTGQQTWYSEDPELNFYGSLIEASSSAEAIERVKSDIAELMLGNCLIAEAGDDDLSVFEPSDHEFVERYYHFCARRSYALLDETGKSYHSDQAGRFGGHRKLKIYGRLDCPSAARYIAKGQYVQHRVFFKDEQTAIKAGYRPCAVCMPEAYARWKSENKN